jgi:hypothetical protein
MFLFFVNMVHTLMNQGFNQGVLNLAETLIEQKHTVLSYVALVFIPLFFFLLRLFVLPQLCFVRVTWYIVEIMFTVMLWSVAFIGLLFYYIQ